MVLRALGQIYSIFFGEKSIYGTLGTDFITVSVWRRELKGPWNRIKSTSIHIDNLDLQIKVLLGDNEYLLGCNMYNV